MNAFMRKPPGGTPRQRTAPTVRCQISIFGEVEKEILQLTHLINATKDAVEKERYAKLMLRELGVLLSCHAYNEKDENCVNCRSASSIRKKAGEVVLKGIQLARFHRGEHGE